jgi:hypothetical protein
MVMVRLQAGWRWRTGTTRAAEGRWRDRIPGHGLGTYSAPVEIEHREDGAGDALLLSAREGDEDAFRVLVEAHRDEGHPHLRPVLAVYLDEPIYSTTSPAARKGRDLARRPSAALAARAPAIDIVIEGRVAWIDGRQRPERVGDAYRDKYG